jgi:hypothetical protein
MRDEAMEGHTVPDLATNSLLSVCTIADANYITLFTKEEVLVFDAETAKVNIEGKAVMRGWRCPQTRLWRVPIRQKWSNLNTDTLLLSAEATDIIMNKRNNAKPTDFVNSVYELPNLEQVIAWYHAAAGYPTKTTWLKAIEAGFYATWPMLTTKAVRKHYPETKETPKGHMKRVRSGVRSTKVQVQQHPEITEAEAALAEI